MTKLKLAELSSEDLVNLFARIVTAQDEALLGSQRTRFKRLFLQMMDVVQELKRRNGDQRLALTKLYNHPNMQVRVQAAKLTLAVTYTEGREQLEAIAVTHWMPQAGDAGMCLSNLDRGIFKPT